MKPLLPLMDEIMADIRERVQNFVNRGIKNGAYPKVVEEMGKTYEEGAVDGVAMGWSAAWREAEKDIIMIRNCLSLNDLDGIARTIRTWNIPAKAPKAEPHA
jgi:hypothetical protein